MTPLPAARTRAARTLPARWFTAPMVALALLGTGAGTSSAAPVDGAGRPQYVRGENEPASTDPADRQDELPPYDALHAQQAVDKMVMEEDADAEGQHCPPQSDDDQQSPYLRLVPHRDAAYPERVGGDYRPLAQAAGEPQIIG
ncbi:MULTISPECIES: hypothetical protein [unclassified Streptomyces]|uniref:hypothetical protein n=1 Tax=unclassified Streptomyces TaxID=2593676 RepID=UPI003809B05C